MKRKLVQQGGLTLMTSLPRSWTKKYDLRKGDEIDIKEQGKDLILSPKIAFGPEKKTLDVTNLHPLIVYGTQAIYVRGVDELEIKSDKPEYIAKLPEKPINQFIGYEIIDQGKDYCKVKDVSNISDQDFDSMQRRVFLLITSMSRDMLEGIEKKQTDLSHIDGMDLSVNRFSFLCMRILMKIGYKDFKYTPIMFFLVMTLETLGDGYRDLAKYITNNKLVLDKNFIDLFREIDSILKDYQKIFFKFDAAKAAEIDAKYRKIKERFESLLDKVNDKKQIRCILDLYQISNLIAELLRNQLVIDL